jgi:hypothetical protein
MNVIGFPEETSLPHGEVVPVIDVQNIHHGSGVIDTTAYPSVVRRRKVRKGCEAGYGWHTVCICGFLRSIVSTLGGYDVVRTSGLPLLEAARTEGDLSRRRAKG